MSERTQTITCPYGGHISNIPYPTTVPPGYKFSGWFTQREGGDQLTPDIIIRSETTYYAHWELDTNTERYKITFDWNYDNKTHTETITYGTQSVQIPSPPPRTGFNFIGWFTEREGGEQIPISGTLDNDFLNGIFQNVTYYAHWEHDAGAQKYKITFDWNDGTEIYSTIVTYGTTSVSLPNTKERDGFNFIGWFTEKEGGEQIPVDGDSIENDYFKQLTEDVTFYAHWERVSKSIDIIFDDRITDVSFIVNGI